MRKTGFSPPCGYASDNPAYQFRDVNEAAERWTKGREPSRSIELADVSMDVPPPISPRLLGASASRRSSDLPPPQRSIRNKPSSSRRSRNAVWSRFNNQDSIIMRLYHAVNNEDHQSFGIFHESRVFYFVISRDANLEQALDDVESQLLTLLTMPKYRLFMASYMLYRVVDRSCFVILVFIAIFEFLYMGEGTLIWNFSYDGTAVFNIVMMFFAIGVELIVDSLEHQSNIWVMARMLPYFGLMEYAVYCFVFKILDIPIPIWVILGVRFVSWICELANNYLIDVELHYDLAANRVRELPFLCWFSGGDIRSASRFINEPDSNVFELNTVGVDAIHFVGSQCGWHLRASDMWMLQELGSVKHAGESARANPGASPSEPHPPYCEEGMQRCCKAILCKCCSHCMGGWEPHRVGLYVIGAPTFLILTLFMVFIQILTLFLCGFSVLGRCCCYGDAPKLYSYPAETVATEVHWV